MDTNILTPILTQGVLGAIAIIEGYVIIKLYNRIEALQDKRAEDAAKGRDAVIDPLKEVQATLKENTNVIQTLVSVFHKEKG